MNALDSPIEAALAFNYLNSALSTAVNNIWPCLAAVVTAAAISFWKIRAAGFAAAPAESERRVDDRISDPRSSTASLTTAAAVNLVLESDGGGANEGTGRGRRRRRGKFTVYYESEVEERESTEGGGAGGERLDGGRWRMKVGEDGSMGWYRYQDLTVLDGNVVKLWDYLDVGCGGGREFNKLLTAVW